MSMTPDQELEALRKAIRMMGLDPTKLAELADNPGDEPHPGILLGLVGLQGSKLTKRFGSDERAMLLWQKAWERLAPDA